MVDLVNYIDLRIIINTRDFINDMDIHIEHALLITIDFVC